MLILRTQELKNQICFQIIILSGICAGVKLKTKLGLNEFTIFDENADFGGVCIAKKYDLYKNARFNHQIQTLTWVNNAKKWKVVSFNKEAGTTEEWIFDIVIAGPEPFHVPHIPEKFKSFAGPVIHSAKWDSSVSLKDKTVAVVGSGAAACQIIPGIVNDVKTLYSFQRRPAWVYYKAQVDIPPLARTAIRNSVLLQGFLRAVTATGRDIAFHFHKKNGVAHAMVYCMSNSYYPALARPHVDVIREEVVSVSPEGDISTSDGTTRRVDVIICATGYEQMTTHWFNPVKIFIKEDESEEGDGIDVTKGLREDANFYLGIMTDTLPNMFFLYGPHSVRIFLQHI
ncbi:4-hydroxyacetophenone monooxygenase [Folsomia candida]|uniref:Flavin-containing monooxygenase n=1 Tax=Folsomia candida TaxID=158441 RepID=A0A226EB65_FOLCA|nr:4-hydroxyacetophenone monooxygenase [Folsomia candida]